MTSKDVAQRAGVSRSVVSAVLNGTPGIGVSEEKRQAVLRAIEELNYRIDAHARGMRTGKSRCLAAYGNLDNPLFLQVLQGFQQRCRAHGYQVLLYGTEEGSDGRIGLIDLFLQRRIDGIVTKDTTGYSDPDWLDRVREYGIPFVSVEGYPETDGITSVLMDYAESVVMALDELYTRTGLAPHYLEVYEGPAYRPNWGDRERLKAYGDWMRARGFRPQVHTAARAELDVMAAALAERAAAGDHPIAILSNWSAGAVSVYRAAYRLGLGIGRELRVMAADNTDRVNGYLVPPLSAVEVPYPAMGAAAAQRLIEYVEGTRSPEDTENIWMSAHLVPRESV